ncbi:MAG TPA: Maf family protein [Puia sp.]|jgi:septum formation protein|nr:Maf family protein [Puia sp.]
MDRIILASASPRRKQLLEWAEIPFDQEPSDDDELVPEGLSVSEIPVFLASRKAATVRKRIGTKKIILAADTIVVLDQQMLGKPANRADAIRMLTQLSGRVHEVITGVSLSNDKNEILFSETTLVRFHPLSFSDIEHYVDRYSPYDKAGAYAIQEWIGVTGIHSIDGDFYNVMGLPVSRVMQELKTF